MCNVAAAANYFGKITAMRISSRVLLVALLAAVLLCPAPRPAVAFEMKICDYCRRAWDDSPSRIRGTADANGHVKEIYACSPYCLAEVLKLKPHYKLEAAQIVLWEKRGELSPMLVNCETAKFLSGVKDERDLSHDPDVAAFRTDKQLAAGKKALGGSTVTWAKIMEKCRKLAAEAEEEEDDSYSPLHFRKY
jgi:hypothetical protein